MHKITQNLKHEFLKNRNLVFVLFTFFMVATLSFFATSNMHESSAANPNDFRPGNIISDAVMANYNSMNEAEIQNFLNSKNKCDNRNYDLYLQYTAAHPTITWHWEGEPYNGHFVCLAEEKFGDNNNEIGTGKTAARIIYEAAQEYKINPQAILVLLQKESSLITDKVPNSYDYGQATGYGCPDTAACDKKYSGFKNQVHRAAELFRYVLDNNSRYYPAGRNVFVGYHPSASCGGSQVYIENRATAALYQYTPYQPNSAALAAGYGQGDTCSAYGNRNFYFYFTDWFGSTQASVDGELVTIPDGEYNLSSAVGSNRALGTLLNNAELVTLDVDDSTQRWQIERDATTGYYQLTNVQTKRPLIVQSVEVNNNTNVINGNSTTCSKWWKIYQTKDNYLTFESTCTSGMVLDVSGGSANIGTNVEMYIADDTKAQKWQLLSGPTLPDGIYSITTSIDSTRVLDIAGGSRSNGANVQLYGSNKTLAQKWIIKYDYATDSYSFTNPVSNKLLEVINSSTSNGANVQTYAKASVCAQRWQIVQRDDNNYTIISTCSPTKVLDLSNGRTAGGTNIQIWSFDRNTSAQKWQFIASPEPEDGTYSISSAVASQNTKVIDLSNASPNNGANIQLWSYDINTSAQKWQLAKDQDGYYSIINPVTNKSLDIFAADIRNGINIHQYGLHNGCTQKWRIVESAEDFYAILTSCDTNYALDVSSGRDANGTNIQLWTYDGNANAQRWNFIKRTDTPTTIEE